MAPSLTTARLHLRPVAPGDEAGVLEALNDLAVAGWLAVVPYPYSDADFRLFQGEMAHPGATFAIQDAAGFAGILGMEKAVLGYWLCPHAQGRGYATEAARAVLAAHFAEGGGDVTAGHFEGNAASANVLRKLGFVETGRAERFCRPLDRMRPHVELRLTRNGFVSG